MFNKGRIMKEVLAIIFRGQIYQEAELRTIVNILGNPSLVRDDEEYYVLYKDKTFDIWTRNLLDQHVQGFEFHTEDLDDIKKGIDIKPPKGDFKH